MKKRISVIWNVTRLCPFNCPFCCVSAIYVEGFRQIVPFNRQTPAFQGELSFSQQIAVLDQMKQDDFRIDFSGGDVFINPQNIDLILYASEKFGSNNIGLSIPGTFINTKLLDKLQGKIFDIEITLDNIPDKSDDFRPTGYAQTAVNAFRALGERGFSIGAQTVLRTGNMDYTSLKNLHSLLVKLGVSKWSLLKFFPVGRFYGHTSFIPPDSEYRKTTKYIEMLCNNSSVMPHFQYLLPHHQEKSFSCRAVEKSIGINPSGYVSACFWALNKDGMPLDEFNLGKVPEQNIYSILQSEKALKWKKICVNDCKNNCGLTQTIQGRLV